MIYRDQMGLTLELEQTPKRIVSLVPSQTELLYHLGISPIAQTIFCVHPESEFKNATKIGGTKKLQIDKIRALKPDLIIGNKEENVKDQIEELEQDFPVWMSDVNTLDDALSMIEKLGEVLGRKLESGILVDNIKTRFNRLIDGAHTKSFVYLIWQEPFYAVANHTFIHDVLKRTGLQNAVAHLNRYPELSLEELKEVKPEIIFLSTEPYPFQEKHVDELKDDFPNVQILLIDGELCSWYGNRLLKTPDYLNSVLENLS